jgi:hypothetical protein
MAINIDGEHGSGITEFQEDVMVPGTTSGDAPPGQPAAAAAAAAGNIQDDPAFKALPRHIQKQVEAGEIDIGQATAAAQAEGNKPGTAPPTPQAQVPQPAASPLAGQTPGQTTRQNNPVPLGAGPSRLTAGQALEGGKQGQNTFRRSGTQGFRAFAGQEFNPFLLRPEAAGAQALTARQALEQGDVGRQAAAFGGPGTAGSGDDPNKRFLNDLL